MEAARQPQHKLTPALPAPQSGLLPACGLHHILKLQVTSVAKQLALPPREHLRGVANWGSRLRTSTAVASMPRHHSRTPQPQSRPSDLKISLGRTRRPLICDQRRAHLEACRTASCVASHKRAVETRRARRWKHRATVAQKTQGMQQQNDVRCLRTGCAPGCAGRARRRRKRGMGMQKNMLASFASPIKAKDVKVELANARHLSFQRAVREGACQLGGCVHSCAAARDAIGQSRRRTGSPAGPTIALQTAGGAGPSLSSSQLTGVGHDNASNAEGTPPGAHVPR